MSENRPFHDEREAYIQSNNYEFTGEAAAILATCQPAVFGTDSSRVRVNLDNLADDSKTYPEILPKVFHAMAVDLSSISFTEYNEYGMCKRILSADTEEKREMLKRMYHKENRTQETLTQEALQHVEAFLPQLRALSYKLAFIDEYLDRLNKPAKLDVPDNEIFNHPERFDNTLDKRIADAQLHMSEEQKRSKDTIVGAHGALMSYLSNMKKQLPTNIEKEYLELKNAA